jgi:enoyl-CoA hydratase/carnithine racemase
MTPPPGGWRRLRVRQDGALLIVELDRPRLHNAADTRMHAELQVVLAELRGAAADLRAVVVTGRGRSFCSGTDLNDSRGMSTDELRRYVALDAATKDAVAECAVPTIAWVHGYALGGGMELALACDFRAVTADAVLGLPEVQMGTLPGAGGIQRLSALAGPALAREVVLLGRRLTGAQAHGLGLATWLVDGALGDADGMATLHEITAPLAAADPVAVELARAALAPTALVSPLERTFHTVAAVAAHGTGTFATRAGATLQRGEGR